jgi:glycolate oxidase FAD binding subunit
MGGAMRPATEGELAEIIRGANGPLAIRGGGTRGVRQAAGEVLETGGLSGITLYEPGALTLVAKAGTSLADIAATLAAERQRLAFEVPDLRGLLGRHGVSTIGGVVAANASGPRRMQAGACRDNLIGVRLVDGAGTIIKNGGRVMKNVTGYDLVKLMAGAYGTLGVLTEVSFKLQAVPEAEATVVLPIADAAAAVGLLSRVLASPYDLSGAAYDGRVLVRLEGMAGSVAYRSAALQGLIGGDIVTGPDSAAIWAGVRDVAAFHGRSGAVWRVSVKPTDGPAVVVGLTAGADFVMDWGGGLVWLRVPQEGDAGATRLRGLVARLGGHATLVRGPSHVVAFHPEPAPVAALTRALRAKFDPRGFLNPGLMGNVDLALSAVKVIS